MFNGNWVRVFAVAGFLALGLFIAWWLEPGASSVTEANTEIDQSAGYYEGEVTCNADCQVTFGLSNRQAKNQEDKANPNGSSTDKNALSVIESDLLAQERMAYWTRLIGAFTAIGLAVLAGTLWEAFRATQAASAAADLARQTLNGDRAWLLMGDIDTAANNQVDAKKNLIRPDFFFNMRMTNSGRSPAINVEIRRQLKVEQRPIDPETVSIDTNVQWSATVPVGSDQKTTIHWFQVSIDALRSVRNGTHRVLMLVEVRYNDIFTDQQHVTRACCEVLVVLPEDRLLWRDVPIEMFQFPAVGINDTT